MRVHLYPPSSLSSTSRLRWYARPSLPLELVDRDYSSVRKAFAEFVRDQHYDLVWVIRLPTFVAVGRLPDAPTIVDVDDLRGDWHTTRLAANGRGSGGINPKHQLNRLFVRRNAALWRRLEAQIASRSSAVVVCSEADLSRLALTQARAVPNGYDRPEHPVGRASVGRPPTIVFQGGLHYPPNIDAARYLVERILPRLRGRLPNVQVRLVGSAAPAVEKLASHERVVVTGRVPNIEDELERADLVAVPIRFGGGTRIKILEAFAHRIPVVSTSLGAYGLDVVDGRHLRLADTPEDFADACVSLLTDEGARKELADEAEALFLKSYQWCDIASSIRELALSVVRASEPDNKGNDAKGNDALAS
jgi:glycosyltransferase involved in cell wall biosynthesis